MAIMEDIFKTKEGDREKEIDRFQKSLADLETKLLKIDEMFVAGDLEKDSYQRMKASYKDEIPATTGSNISIDEYRHQLYEVLPLWYVSIRQPRLSLQQASPYVRKKLLGSIFTGKLIFENGNYRTTGLNEAVALIGQFQKEFGHKKAERLDISDKTFGNVPIPGQL